MLTMLNLIHYIRSFDKNNNQNVNKIKTTKCLLFMYYGDEQSIKSTLSFITAIIIKITYNYNIII